MKYERVYTDVFRKPWAILPEKLAVIADVVGLRAAGEKLTDEQIRERLALHAATASSRQYNSGQGVVAVIPIFGVISHHVTLMSQVSGGTSIDKLTSQFRQAVGDASIKTIVFDVDSPGGAVEGVPELADEIFQSRGKKRTIAVANSLSASAAYWLAAAAGELVVIPSGSVGSIGVFCAHEDVSGALAQEGINVSLISAGKYKVEGNPFGPLSGEAREELQSKVDAFYQMFVKSVARGRNVSQTSVREGFGQGRMVLAADAVKNHMADRVATFDQTIARLGAGGTQGMIAAQASGQSMSIEERRRQLDAIDSLHKRRDEIDSVSRTDEDSSVEYFERRRRELKSHGT